MANDEVPVKQIIVVVLVFLAAIMVLMLVFGSWFKVSKGDAGCIFSNTEGWDYTEKDQGWHFKMPVVESVEKMTFRTQTLGMYSEGEGEKTYIVPKDKNGINFNVDVTLRYRMDTNQICEFIEQKGRDPEPLLITALRADSTRGVFGQYAQEDVPQNRIEIASKVKEVLQNRINAEASGSLGPNFIIVEAVDLRDVQFAQRIEDAIIEKQTRKQEAEKQSYILQQAEMEKEIAIVRADASRQAQILEAQGRGEAILIEATAKASGISKINDAYKGMPASYVDVKYAEALKAMAEGGNNVVVDFGRFKGGENIGFLDYNKLMGSIYDSQIKPKS